MFASIHQPQELQGLQPLTNPQQKMLHALKTAKEGWLNINKDAETLTIAKSLENKGLISIEWLQGKCYIHPPNLSGYSFDKEGNAAIPFAISGGVLLGILILILKNS